MDLNTVFKLSLYGLIAFVGWVLGTAEGGWIPYGSLPFVMIGYWWCEVARSSNGRPLEGMGNTMGSACGFIAATAALNEFLSENAEAKLLAGTHLLVYLTWILLLQRKSNYICWLLMAIGVLQMAVASVLTSATWFGICVIIYLFASTWVLSLFSLRRVAQEFEDASGKNSTPGGQWQNHGSVQSTSPGMSISVNGLSGDGTSATPVSSEMNEPGGAILHHSGEHWLSPLFVGGVAFSAACGLVMSSIFFLFIPRVWVGSSISIDGEDIPAIRRKSVSGFSSEVRLGDLGQIMESLSPVLEARLINNKTGVALIPNIYAQRLGQREPLFRGAVLSSYANGRWKSDRLADSPPLRLHPKPELHEVRQEIRLEQINTNVLFCMGRAVSIVDERNMPQGRFHWFSDIVFRDPNQQKKTGPISYVAYSELPEEDGKNVIGFSVRDSDKQRYEATNYLSRNLEIPSGLQRTINLAKDVVSAEQRRMGRPLSDLETARAIESHLRDSGQYSYTLDLSVTDPEIDLVEDFLFNRRQGHCEYFAAALAMMLRSVGIPARVITGFKGGEYDSSTQTLFIRQCYAHAWVEAFIGQKAWVTLDATPEMARANLIANVGTGRTMLSDFRFHLSNMWSENVINISLDRQNELFYQPLLELKDSVIETVQVFWQSPRDSFRDWWAIITDTDNWFSAGGAFTVLLLSSVAWYGRRYLRRFGLSWGTNVAAANNARRQIEFYERFVRLTDRLGLHRDPSQTQSEFAGEVVQHLVQREDAANSKPIDGESPREQVDSLIESPHILASLFYRVRFGKEGLSESEATQVNSLLARFEQSLTRDGERSSHA